MSLFLLKIIFHFLNEKNPSSDVVKSNIWPRFLTFTMYDSGNDLDCLVKNDEDGYLWKFLETWELKETKNTYLPSNLNKTFESKSDSRIIFQ